MATDHVIKHEWGEITDKHTSSIISAVPATNSTKKLNPAMCQALGDILSYSLPVGDTAVSKAAVQRGETVRLAPAKPLPGAIHLKNWKVLTFDSITEDRAATIHDILRDLKDYALRIRVSRRPLQSCVDEMKEKLLHLLVSRSQELLADIGCPMDKEVLSCLSTDGSVPDVSQEIVANFWSWYNNHTPTSTQSSSIESPTNVTTTPSTYSSSTTSASSTTSSSSTTHSSSTTSSSSTTFASSTTSSSSTTYSSSTTSASSSTAASSIRASFSMPAIFSTTATSCVVETSTTAASSMASTSSITANSSISATSTTTVTAHTAAVPSSPCSVSADVGLLQASCPHSLQSVSSPLPVTVSLSSPSLVRMEMTNGHSPDPQVQSGTICTPFKCSTQVSSKSRIRTSFDPEHEISRLQKWFSANRHPGRSQMVLFVEELNRLESRKGRRPLDLTNIIYWFKNARAAQRRATKAYDDSFDVEERGTGSDRQSPSGPSSQGEADVCQGDVPPYLPNKNAVYVIPYPYHAEPVTGLPDVPSQRRDVESSDVESSDEPCDLSVKKLLNDDCLHAVPKDDAFSQSPKITNMDGGKSTDTTCGEARDRSLRECDLDHGIKREKLCTENSATRCQDILSPMRGVKPFVERRHYIEQQRFPSENPQATSDVSFRTDCAVNPGRAFEESLKGGDSARSVIRSGPVRDASSVNMAALSLAQMSQQAPMQMAFPPLNALAMYYNLPHYYSQPPSHHASAVVAAAFGCPTPLNGHHHPPYGGTPDIGLSRRLGCSDCNHMSDDASEMSHGQDHLGVTGSTTPTSRSTTDLSDARKRRTRVFIDPLTEIPVLEKWFTEDTHPSAYMIEKYAETLNAAMYRQKFPKLEPKNIQLWFKNHRAKVKRLRVGVDSDGMSDSPPPSGHVYHSRFSPDKLTGRERLAESEELSSRASSGYSCPAGRVGD